MKSGILAFFLGFTMMLAFLGTKQAFPRDLEGKYAQSPLNSWFNAQKNKNGVPCCDTADGHRLEDADWQKNEDGSYSVHLEGQWIVVPPNAVIEPKSGDPIDYAVVWIFHGVIECFRPGTLV